MFKVYKLLLFNADGVQINMFERSKNLISDVFQN